MSVLLYAVTEANGSPLPQTGLEGHPLRALAHRNLEAIVSDHEVPPPSEVHNLWAYEEVVERLMGTRALLPARYGTTAAQESEIEGMLAERHEELSAGIERVRGAVELAVRPAEPPQAAGEATSGSDYLKGRLAQAHQLGRLEEQAGRGIRAKAERGRGGRAYLVERHSLEAFMAHAAEAGLTVTGPWPPYSFVDQPRERAEAEAVR